MSLAQRTRDGFLMGLIGGDDGVVLVTGGPDVVWTGLDADLEPRWQIARPRPLHLFERHFVEEGVVRRIERDGTITPLVRVAALDGDGLGCVLAVNDGGFLVARGQRILRIDRAGRSLWSDVRTLPGVPTQACVSGDRLLVATDSLEYTHWGYLGPACLLRLDDGTLVKELRGERIAAFDDAGQVLTALEGYDAFDTWLYDRDGALVQTWRTCGRMVADPDGTVRVLEMDRRIPTRSRIVRLHRDGAIERGAELRDPQCSPPLVLDDGRLVFVDGGRVRAVDRALRVTELAALSARADDEPSGFHARVARLGGRLVVALSERLPEREQPQTPGRTAGDIRYRCDLHVLDADVPV